MLTLTPRNTLQLISSKTANYKLTSYENCKEGLPKCLQLCPINCKQVTIEPKKILAPCPTQKAVTKAIKQDGVRDIAPQGPVAQPWDWAYPTAAAS